MKHVSTALLILAALTPIASNAIPQSSIATTRSQMSADSNKQVAKLHRTLETTKRALNRYYSNEKSWPASLNVLESKGYLPINYASPLGGLTYGGAGNSLTLTLNLPAGSEGSLVANRVASLAGGNANGSAISLQLTPPVGFIDAERYIDRINPKSLATDINMNGQWVRNSSLQGDSIDVTKASGEELNATRDASVGRNLLVVGQLQGKEANLGNSTYQKNVTALDLMANGPSVVGGKFEATNVNLNENTTFQEIATLNSTTTSKSSMRINAPLVIAGNAAFNNASTFQDLIAGGQIAAYGGITGTQASFQSGLIEQIQSKNAVINDGNVTGKVNANSIQAGDIKAVNGEFSGNLTTQGLVTKNAVQANNGLYVGTSNVLVADKDGNLYQRGKRLDQVLLGKDGKAVDTALLDGLSISDFSVLDLDRTFSAKNSFNGLVQFNSVGYAGGKQFIDPATGRLFEAGQALDSRYLGINAKAADSDLLDGLTASAYGQLAAANTFSQQATFSQGLQVNGNLMSGGTTVASNGQWFEGGQALTLRYLGINGKAANSALLDGVSAGQFAQRGSNNTFTGANTFNQDVTVGGQALLGSVRAVESRTGSLEGRVASTNSQLDNLLYIKSRCRVHANDPGCRFVFVPKVINGTWVAGKSVYHDEFFENGSGGCGSSAALIRGSNVDPPQGAYLPKVTTILSGTCSPQGSVAYRHVKSCMTFHGGSSNTNYRWVYDVYPYTCQ
ncbi:hypothetical protein ACK32R_03735 [Aeromonas dhakensis]|uniref:hypothetical protein n=1 Tax=Aeromonas dhakensis TaxID=196024 RepID=UPI003985806C